jgi:hypothetical protein
MSKLQVAHGGGGEGQETGRNYKHSVSQWKCSPTRGYEDSQGMNQNLEWGRGARGPGPHPLQVSCQEYTDIFFLSFCGTGDWTLGLTLVTSALPLEPCPQSFCFQFIFQIGSHANFTGLASDFDSPVFTSWVAEITGMCHHTQLRLSFLKRKKKKKTARFLWLMPVILATQKVQIRKITVQSQPGQIVVRP